MIIPPLANPSGQLEWARRVREAINGTTNGYPWLLLEADPSIADLRPSFTYYNTTTNTIRWFNGTIFGNL